VYSRITKWDLTQELQGECGAGWCCGAGDDVTGGDMTSQAERPYRALIMYD